LPGAHKRTRAFIKVQDGCDNHCTFCVTRIARGSNHSVPESEVFEDIESALLGGAKEIVLSGVNLGAWGRDRKPHKNLVWLINQIVAKLSPPRLRLSSLEPWDIQDEFSDVLNLPGFCRHLHLPLQSGSDAILRRMARRTSTEDFARILSNLRRSHPQIAITTDVMVGFPGESEMHFEESINFVKSLGFSGGHVFNYSNRPGTAAEKLPDQIPSMIRKERSKEMRDVINNSALLYQQQFIGSTVNVLWEKAISSPDGFQLSGLTDNYLRIEAFSNDDLYNQIAPFKITKSDGHVLIAEAIL
jgi:threonylcarbamoyladenosine tRNA methylthiotransferase MtaB